MGFETCTADGCSAQAVVERLCAAHVLGTAHEDNFYELIRERRELPLAGTTLRAEVLMQMVQRVPLIDGRQEILSINMDHAEITGDLHLDINVRYAASFNSTRFKGRVAVKLEAAGPVVAHAAIFESDLRVDGVFHQDVSFLGAEFLGPVSLAGSEIRGDLGLERCVFTGPVDLGRIRVYGLCDLSGATFRGRVQLDGCRVATRLLRAALASWHVPDPNEPLPALGFRLVDVGFGETLDLSHAQLGGTECSLVRCTFAANILFDNCEISASHVVIDRCVFPTRLSLNVRSRTLYLRQVEFRRTVTVDVVAAGVAVEACSFAAPALIRGGSRSPRIPPPRLLSCRLTDLRNLRTTDMDLAACRFGRAHNLDHFDVEGDLLLVAPTSPRLSRRRMLAEEWEWRARVQNWQLPASVAWPPPNEDGHPGKDRPVGLEDHNEAAIPSEIGPLYRRLRKGIESRGDEAGAADLYFGEMEMRRFAAPKPSAERAILWLYWLVSGYGLRAARATLALICTVALFSLAFRYGGAFHQPPSFSEAFLIAAENTTTLLRPAVRLGLQPTELGRVYEILLRLLGPLFFALALLALRARVRRA